MLHAAIHAADTVLYIGVCLALMACLFYVIEWTADRLWLARTTRNRL
jgi:hypothetical protein